MNVVPFQASRQPQNPPVNLHEFRRSIRDASLSGPDKGILHTICSYPSAIKGFAKPSTATLARHSGHSRRTVVRSLERLEKGDWIEREAQRRRGLKAPSIIRILSQKTHANLNAPLRRIVAPDNAPLSPPPCATVAHKEESLRKRVLIKEESVASSDGSGRHGCESSAHEPTPAPQPPPTPTADHKCDDVAQEPTPPAQDLPGPVEELTEPMPTTPPSTTPSPGAARDTDSPFFQTQSGEAGLQTQVAPKHTGRRPPVYDEPIRVRPEIYDALMYGTPLQRSAAARALRQGRGLLTGELEPAHTCPTEQVLDSSSEAPTSQLTPPRVESTLGCQTPRAEPEGGNQTPQEPSDQDQNPSGSESRRRRPEFLVGAVLVGSCRRAEPSVVAEELLKLGYRPETVDTIGPAVWGYVPRVVLFAAVDLAIAECQFDMKLRPAKFGYLIQDWVNDRRSDSMERVKREAPHPYDVPFRSSRRAPPASGLDACYDAIVSWGKEQGRSMRKTREFPSSLCKEV